MKYKNTSAVQIIFLTDGSCNLICMLPEQLQSSEASSSTVTREALCLCVVGGGMGQGVLVTLGPLPCYSQEPPTRLDQNQEETGGTVD